MESKQPKGRARKVVRVPHLTRKKAGNGKTTVTRKKGK
jgi:hypothetical protein